MVKQIIVTEASKIKEGFKNGRKWELFKVKDQDNLTYTTFDSKYAGIIGQSINIEYVEEQNGQYTNRKIIEPRKPNPNQDLLEKIDKKLDLILHKLSNPVIKEEHYANPDDFNVDEINQMF